MPASVKFRVTTVRLILVFASGFLGGALSILAVLVMNILDHRSIIAEYVQASKPALEAAALEGTTAQDLWRALNPCVEDDRRERPEGCELYDDSWIRPPIKITLDEERVAMEIATIKLWTEK